MRTAKTIIESPTQLKGHGVHSPWFGRLFIRKEQLTSSIELQIISVHRLTHVFKFVVAPIVVPTIYSALLWCISWCLLNVIAWRCTETQWMIKRILRPIKCSMNGSYPASWVQETHGMEIKVHLGSCDDPFIRAQGRYGSRHAFSVQPKTWFDV